MTRTETGMDITAAKEDPALGPPKNIWEAAERGMVGWIVRQVERNIEYDINMRDKLQRNALHWAAEVNKIETAEALLDYNCDPAALECNGRTPIHLAAREGHVEMLKLLMENMDGARKEYYVNLGDNFGLTPVFLSLQKGEETRAAFEYLMECGGRYNSQMKVPKVDPAPPPSKD